MTAYIVDDATLATISGKYFGAQMLVGLRVDLVSSLDTPQQGSTFASGALLVERRGGGFEVQVDARSGADAGNATLAAGAAGANASGAESVQVRGIGQIAQIAGDGNRLRNLTSIAFVDRADAAGFNGQSHSQASAGAMSARVTFLDGGARIAVDGPGASLQQRLDAGAVGGIAQLGRIAGNGVDASNRMQLQIVTSAITPELSRQLGLQQALDGLRAVPR
ncbi:hypothetical protein [Lysobacter capsici]|uniref:hypothetical protein n=1 Tax=Lysobacter capsici TaxID=435897 RepID=UPI001C0089E0|nr:hypothetical protein [Lysobacter capsici]QWF17264.1 hypothetical protein KME82_00185 [Lysobacter capsici]